jgi:hypothetical protein
MDDDDYYPPYSLIRRIIYMEKSNRDCVFCSSLGCFEINKYISFINVPPHKLELSKRVSEATLCYKKTFWLKGGFKEESVGGEGHEFINGRELNCLEISWRDIIVVLLHTGNTSNKEIPKEVNGSYYGFTDELFEFITCLDK